MNIPTIPTSLRRKTRVPFLVRYGVATLLGLYLSARGAGGEGDMMLAALFIPIFYGGLSVLTVFLCGLIGRSLYLDEPGRGHAALSIGLIAVGISLYTHGINARTLLRTTEEGEFYELAATFWPGYCLLMFGVVNLPIPLWHRRRCDSL